jgi:hypothetical protein
LSWYEWLWYHDLVDFPEDKRKLGQWLGLSHNYGNVMCACVLAANGQILSCTTYSLLSVANHNS